jgi:hypothetical protein
VFCGAEAIALLFLLYYHVLSLSAFPACLEGKIDGYVRRKPSYFDKAFFREG